MELSNYHLTREQEYSNAADPVTAVAGAVTAMSKLKQQVSIAKAARDAKMAESGCNKPIINVGKKRREYLQCIREFNSKNAGAFIPVIFFPTIFSNSSRSSVSTFKSSIATLSKVLRPAFKIL